MVEDRFHRSVGTLRYTSLEDGASKLIVEVDRDIAFLARALIPKAINIKGTRFLPHISVIRHEFVCKHPKWGLHEGKRVPFEYGSYVHDNGTFYWLRARSDELVQLRLDLGLTAHSRYSRPPDGTRWFHITVGNTKA